MSRQTPCIETDDENRKTHAWQTSGLDIVAGTLCTTRTCVWCGLAQHKAYGAGGRKSWSVTRDLPASVDSGNIVADEGQR